MYLSLNLLKQLAPNVNIKDIDSLESILNSIGVEVEEVIKFRDIKNIAIGKIIDIEKPNSNAKVNLCTVNVNGKSKKIICGAKNIFVGANVIVALPGAKIANDIVINEREIMGIKSEGMICGYAELNDTFCNSSEEENNGVIILDEFNQKSNPFSIIGLDDVILDISLPSNRNDLNSLMWIIQEISIFYDLNFKLNKFNKNSNEKQIKIVNEKLIKNYFAISFNLEEQKISWKTKSLLMNSGFKPTNTISDIGVFNQLLFGFSVYAIDNELFKSLKFVKIEKDEKVKIDDVIYKIPKDTICLKSENNEIVIVIGIGVNDKFKVTKNSKSILFFSSQYDYLKNNEIFNLNKNIPTISKNNLKSLSPNILKYQFLNLLDLLKVKFKNIKVSYSFNNHENKGFKIDIKKMNNMLSTNIDSKTASKILKMMGYKSKDNLWIQPINRNDVDNEVAIYEDILKVYGVNNIRPNPIENTTTIINSNIESDLLNEIRKLFKFNGFYEIKTYNLCDNKNLSFNFFKYKNHIKVKNPISLDKENLRLSLLTGVINTYSFNSRVNNNLERVFEIQNIYHGKNKEKHLIFAVPYNPYENKITSCFIKNDILYSKNILNNIFSLLNKKVIFKKSFNEDFGCENDSLEIYNIDSKIGYLTRINPEILKSNKIANESIYVCEINISNLLNIDNDYVLEDESYDQNIWKEITFKLKDGITLNKFYELASNQNLFNQWEFISEFKKGNDVFYTITFNIIHNNNVQQSFDKIIDLLNSNGMLVKDS